MTKKSEVCHSLQSYTNSHPTTACNTEDRTIITTQKKKNIKQQQKKNGGTHVVFPVAVLKLTYTFVSILQSHLAISDYLRSVTLRSYIKQERTVIFLSCPRTESIDPLKELQSMLVKTLVLYWFCLHCLLKLKCYLQKYTN